MALELRFLDDLLNDPRGFEEAVLELAGDFRRNLGLPEVVHELGVVCPDVEAAADYLESTYEDMGPFFLARGAPRQFSDHGKPTRFGTAVGFGYYQGVLIELAEPGEGSDIFATHLDTEDGRITLHHLGFFARGDDLTMQIGPRKKDTKDFLPEMQALGYEPEWEALVGLAGFSGKVTIFDCYDKMDGLALEFLDIRWGRGKKGKGGVPMALDTSIPMLGKMQTTMGPRLFTLSQDLPDDARDEWPMAWRREFPDTPMEELWTWLTDPEHMSQWVSGILFQSEESAQAGLSPDEPGSVREIWLRPLKKRGKPRPDKRPRKKPYIREQIHAVHRPEGGPWRIEFGIIEGGDVKEQGGSMILTPMEGGGTHLNWEMSLVPKAWGAGLFLFSIVNKGTEKGLGVLEDLLGGDNWKTRERERTHS